MTELMCKAIVKDNQIQFTGPVTTGITLEEQIQEDKKYGMMVPRNGKYFTWRAENWESNLITHKQILKGINYSWMQAEIEIVLDVRRAKPEELPDFRVAFRRTKDDSELTKDTLMYHYYPINEITHPLRGLCVVNVDFPLTVHVNAVSLNDINQIDFPDHETAPMQGKTWDFDQIYTHEGPGHGLGLPHSPFPYHVMSSSYNVMAEFFVPWDKKRLVAKYGARPWYKKHFYTRWLNWYKVRSDRY